MPEDSESWVLVDYDVGVWAGDWTDIIHATKYSRFETEFRDGSKVRFEGSLWTDGRGRLPPYNVVWNQERVVSRTCYWVPSGRHGGYWELVPWGLVVIPADEVVGHDSVLEH